MQKMHWCTANLNLSGQGFTVIWFDATNPISWPEAQVLMVVHGEENIYDIKPIAIGETTVSDEKQRLAIKYRHQPVEHVFPGRNPRMETMMPAETLELPRADQFGMIVDPNDKVSIITGGGNGTPHPVEEPPPAPKPPPADQDDDDDEEDAKAAAPVPGPAVFLPGKHPRPHKGA